MIYVFSQLQKELDTSLHLPASVTTEEKKTQTPKTTKVFFIFNAISLFHEAGLFLRKADSSSPLPQKSPQQCQVVLPGGLKHKKMPFVAGKVKAL